MMDDQHIGFCYVDNYYYQLYSKTSSLCSIPFKFGHVIVDMTPSKFAAVVEKYGGMCNVRPYLNIDEGETLVYFLNKSDCTKFIEEFMVPNYISVVLYKNPFNFKVHLYDEL